ncbi:hypothetical protein MLD38_031025 [Melastoma candidum]|uniref:Uncharacterized protein n=1 Tax=Melastoma candidum TaxID=119954 RepID=A0ACB9MQK0_9MYRT|nr:hypothetical protein MLD38_031025 [Melastoma candidum]
MRVKEEVAAFPSPLETIAASALLLLSGSGDEAAALPRSPTLSSKNTCLDVIPAKDGSGRSSASSESADSKSDSSSLTSGVSSAGSHSRKIRVITARLRGKLQVSRRARSKVSFITKLSPGKNDSASSGSSFMKPTLSSTSTSSGSTVAETGSFTRVNDKLESACGKQHIRSAHIALRAEAILKLLSEGSAHETRIRKELGDSPDTSKALRTLLKLEEVKRSGNGGRRNPFIYTIAQRELRISAD